MVCKKNLTGISTAAAVYANENNEKWMIPPYNSDIDYANGERINYTPGSGVPVGYERDWPSLSRDTDASTALSVTRCFWMLVRADTIRPSQFVCPSSSDERDPTGDPEPFYDFTDISNVSYGYQVPFGPRDTRPREGADNRQILAADQGPFYVAPSKLDWLSPETGEPIRADEFPRAWRPYNSPNHGGSGNGEGQNCIYGDRHVEFARKPAVGIDDDNIYTLMTDAWDQPHGANRAHGAPPSTFPTRDPFPGDGALGSTDYSSTDSLIYP